MTTDEPAASSLSPDEAFAIVGDETRLEILRTLSETDEPRSFSELFERCEYDDSSNFSYHLDKLDGHFISRTDDGYALRQAGRRVVEAVIAGRVTADPLLERALTDRPCPFCSAPIEVSYEQERVKLYCTECPGVGRQDQPKEHFDTEVGTLGHISLPPAGVQERTPTEILDTAQVWSNLDLLGDSAGVCSRCSGTVEHSLTVCEDHDASTGVCGHCERRYAVLFEVECSTCPNSKSGIAIVCLLAETELWAFLTEYGMNPLVPETQERAPGTLGNYAEEVRSFDPLRVELTFTVDDDALTLTIDEDVSVVDVTRDRSSASI